MEPSALFPATVVLAAGLGAQVAADRLRIPSIVLLLAFGALLGPDLLGVVDPAIFGAGLRDIVGLAVAVILFEGGLGVDLHRLRDHRRSLLLLLTVGAATSLLGGTLAAAGVLDFPWPIAALYGALMIVTGPTVVTPLVARLPLSRRVKDLLVNEGVLIDPLGAVVALVAVEWVVGRHALVVSGWVVVLRLVIGASAGAAMGLVSARVLRRALVAEHLQGPAILSAMLLTAASASSISAEAGLMAAVAQGVVLANSGVRGLQSLRTFKEALSVVLLSFVFVALAAELDLGEVWALGMRGLLVVALLAWIARPVGVFLATLGSDLSVRERLFVSWICPRGIVAAAVAGLFRTLLDDAQVEGGRELEVLVFLTVAVTVTVQGLSAGAVARLLRVDSPAPGGAVVVGADRLGCLLAAELAARGGQVVLVDRNPWYCQRARSEGLPVYEGDALSLDVLEDAGARYAETVAALTRNSELNALVLERVRGEFRVPHLLAVAPPGGTEGNAEGLRATLLPGRFPGVDEVNRWLAAGQVRVREVEVDESAAGRPLSDYPFGDGEFALVMQRGSAARFATSDLQLAEGDHLVLAAAPGGGRAGEHLPEET
jgi:NhaP-type Na+/H+ or K+/H+ antiporter